MDRGLLFVIFKFYQSQDRLSESLSAIDLYLISFNSVLKRLIAPSKFIR